MSRIPPDARPPRRGPPRNHPDVFLRHPTGSVLTDGAGVIVEANLVAVGLLGAAEGPEAVVGTSFQRFLDAESRRAFDAALARLGRLERSDPLVVELEGRAGPRTVRCSATSLPGGDPSMPLVLWTLEEAREAIAGDGVTGRPAGAAEVEARLLLQATLQLFEARSVAVACRRAAAIAARTLCDGAVLDLVGDDGALRRTAIAPQAADGSAPGPVREHPPLTELLGDGGARRIVEPATLASLFADAGLPDELHAPGEALLVPVPSSDGSGVAGVLSFLRRRRGESTMARWLLLQTYTRIVGRALASARELEDARARLVEAEASARGRHHALVGLCHDFRTPLHAIRGYADLLLEGIPEEIPPRSREHAAAIRRVTDHLGEMVESASGRERTRPGGVIEKREVPLAPILQQVRDVTEDAAGARGLALHIADVDDGDTLTTDPSSLRKVLVNLVDNAIKYTERGEVRLGVETHDAEMVFRVRDTGRGIPPEDLSHVFEPYWRGGTGGARVTSGAGLGLAVVKELVDRLGGRIALESEPGQGTTVTVVHPR